MGNTGPSPPLLFITMILPIIDVIFTKTKKLCSCLSSLSPRHLFFLEFNVKISMERSEVQKSGWLSVSSDRASYRRTAQRVVGPSVVSSDRASYRRVERRNVGSSIVMPERATGVGPIVEKPEIFFAPD